jgi:hypothetical protein
MIPVHFSESVALANVKNYELNRFLSVCDQATAKREKSEIRFGEVLDSVAFRDSLVLYLDSTRRRFRSTVFYEPRYRPKNFSETFYVLPRHTSLSCESASEYHPNKVTRRWYSSSLSFNPREFDSGINIVGPDDVFAAAPDVSRVRQPGPHDKDGGVGSGRHRSTIEVKVCNPKENKKKTSDRNNNVIADANYTIHYDNGDIRATPGKEIVFRAAVKVFGNPA